MSTVSLTLREQLLEHALATQAAAQLGLAKAQLLYMASPSALTLSRLREAQAAYQSASAEVRRVCS